MLWNQRWKRTGRKTAKVLSNTSGRSHGSAVRYCKTAHTLAEYARGLRHPRLHFTPIVSHAMFLQKWVSAPAMWCGNVMKCVCVYFVHLLWRLQQYLIILVLSFLSGACMTTQALFMPPQWWATCLGMVRCWMRRGSRQKKFNRFFTSHLAFGEPTSLYWVPGWHVRRSQGYVCIIPHKCTTKTIF